MKPPCQPNIKGNRHPPLDPPFDPPLDDLNAPGECQRDFPIELYCAEMLYIWEIKTVIMFCYTCNKIIMSLHVLICLQFGIAFIASRRDQIEFTVT